MVPIFFRKVSFSGEVGYNGQSRVMQESKIASAFASSTDSRKLLHSKSDPICSSFDYIPSDNNQSSAPFMPVIISTRPRFNAGTKKTESAGSSSGSPSKSKKGKDKKKQTNKSVNGTSASLLADTPCLDK